MKEAMLVEMEASMYKVMVKRKRMKYLWFLYPRQLLMYTQ
jgi:hypothetical protein